MDDKQIEEKYGKSESVLTYLQGEPCHHRFFRRNAVEIGCKRCPAVWIDNGKITINEDGHLTP